MAIHLTRCPPVSFVMAATWPLSLVMAHGAHLNQITLGSESAWLPPLPHSPIWPRAARPGAQALWSDPVGFQSWLCHALSRGPGESGWASLNPSLSPRITLRYLLLQRLPVLNWSPLADTFWPLFGHRDRMCEIKPLLSSTESLLPEALDDMEDAIKS